jgi:hypothetical protein
MRFALVNYGFSHGGRLLSLSFGLKSTRSGAIIMSPHTNTRVPVDDSYAALVGKAVYVFAYYEWSIIWIIELLDPGFVDRYSRGNPMTSWEVRKALQAVIDNPATCFTKVTKQQLENCRSEFEKLIVKRNALIHAHPYTDADGSQILLYQTKPTKPLPDMKWPKQAIEAIVAEFDNAACSTGVLLDKLS